MNQDFERRTPWPNLDILVNQTGELVVAAELSELCVDAMEIMVEGDKLMISGERQDSDSEKASMVMQKEIPRGVFRRVVDIPKEFDLRAAHAFYHNGILRITVPPKPPASPSNAKEPSKLR